MPISDEKGNVANPFAYGSGHIRPTKAADPGLVYDASYTDYLDYLCNFGVNDLDPTVECPTTLNSPANLNYPSVAVPKLNDTVTITRTVTNVGDAKSTYYFSPIPPPRISVRADPSVLIFDHVGQKKSFNITIKARRKKISSNQENDEYKFGWYTWTDGLHNVRSPIAVSLA